jgi:molybdopterin-binding protein
VDLLVGEEVMTLSARNHLTGTVEEITHDAILCHVVVRVGEHQIESVITRRSADELGLKKGGDLQRGGNGRNGVCLML